VPWKLPFPPVVTLIQSTGREEGQAAYCRGSAIILPQAKVTGQPSGLERLLNHELFHILSSHNPRLRESLYRIIGFQPCEPIDPPAALRDRKITNPDAPLWDAVIALEVNGERTSAVPVLLSRTPQFEPQQGGSFFRYLQFRLLAVERRDEHSWHVPSGREPTLLDPSHVPDFARQIGENTRYILHPDEILADNFVHLVQQTANLPTPHILEQMREVLTTAWVCATEADPSICPGRREH
jgi:hypothetical protein